MFVLFKFGFSFFQLKKPLVVKAGSIFFAHNSDIVCGGSFTVKAVDRQRRGTEVHPRKLLVPYRGKISLSHVPSIFCFHH